MTAALIGVGVLLLVAVIGLITHVVCSSGPVVRPWTEEGDRPGWPFEGRGPKT